MCSTFHQLLLPGLAVDNCTELANGHLEIQAHGLSGSAACPICGQSSTRAHSSYVRTLHDLPLGEHLVTLKVCVRRFRCGTVDCPRRLFTEPLLPLAPRYARRTQRVTTALKHLGVELGGNGAARLARQLRLNFSPTTLLRLIRQIPLPASPSPRIIGLDDWAWRRRVAYGTIVIDLEHRRPLDLLPDRQATTVANWLKQRPSIEVITRDRSTDYASACQQGAPQAQQVLDRWHLLRNLRDALERALRELPPDTLILPSLNLGQTTTVILAAEASRAARVRRYELVKALQAKGLSARQTARQLHLSRPLVSRFYRADTFPERKRRMAWEQGLAPFQVHLQAYWDQGGRNAMQVWRDLRSLGFTGSRHWVARWFRLRREQPAPSTPKCYLTPAYQQARQLQTPAPSLNPPMAPKDLAWLMVSDPKTHSPLEQQVLAQVQQHPIQNRLFTLGRQFVQNLRERNWKDAEAWLTDCENCNLPTFVNFAKGLRQEQSAFVASLREAWSNGPVEGQITRLKLLKRQMYGRAKLDLLRIRFLKQTSSAGHQK